MEKALGGVAPPPRSARSLEIGAGTGYFTLNLAARGDGLETPPRRTFRRGCSTALSRVRPGGLGVRGRDGPLRVGNAATFEDDSFDLVFGHAVLHHLPDLDASFREFRRVPFGRAGSSSAASRRTTATGSRAMPKRDSPRRSRHCGERSCVPARGSRMETVPRRQRPTATTTSTGSSPSSTSTLSPPPTSFERHAAGAGFERRARFGRGARRGLEFGWANRSLESTSRSGRGPVPLAFSTHYHGYIALQTRRPCASRAAPAGGGLLRPAAVGPRPGVGTLATTHPSSASRNGSGPQRRRRSRRPPPSARPPRAASPSRSGPARAWPPASPGRAAAARARAWNTARRPSDPGGGAHPGGHQHEQRRAATRAAAPRRAPSPPPRPNTSAPPARIAANTRPVATGSRSVGASEPGQRRGQAATAASTRPGGAGQEGREGNDGNER